jgi:hypothetical protein
MLVNLKKFDLNTSSETFICAPVKFIVQALALTFGFNFGNLFLAFFTTTIMSNVYFEVKKLKCFWLGTLLFLIKDYKTIKHLIKCHKRKMKMCLSKIDWWLRNKESLFFYLTSVPSIITTKIYVCLIKNCFCSSTVILNQIFQNVVISPTFYEQFLHALKDNRLHCLLLGSTRVKAAHKHAGKIDPKSNYLHTDLTKNRN